MYYWIGIASLVILIVAIFFETHRRLDNWQDEMPDVYKACINCNERGLQWGNFICHYAQDIIFKAELKTRVCEHWEERDVTDNS